MARVGILTFHYANNYGAVLQAYGLSKAIETMGHDVEVIDYRPLAARQNYDRWPIRPLKILPSAVKRWKFRQFRQRYLPLSLRTYWTPEDLKRYPPNVDYLVCGSDQIWNVQSYRGFDPAFFLEFLEKSGPRRVSYAATFGHAQELGDYRGRICELLSQFDHLSVRDARSKNMIRELIGRIPEHVLDPSFLADYSPITPPRMFKAPYIFTYCFSKNDFSMRAVRVLHQRLGIPIISIKTSFVGAKVIRSATPLQWLSLMHHADFVCTNSFHGTCFSLINRKEFLTFPIDKGQSRLEDVLITAGLSNRLVSNMDELERSLMSPVNYDIVVARLDEARRRSEAFLGEALK